jgi:hypothetical protein
MPAIISNDITAKPGQRMRLKALLLMKLKTSLVITRGVIVNVKAEQKQ